MGMSTVIASAVISALPMMVIVGVIMSIIAAFKWHIDKKTATEVAQAMQGEVDSINLSNYIQIKDKSIVFKKDKNGQDIYDVIEKILDDEGLDAEASGLDRDGVLEDIINAEIATEYPYLGGDGLQGIVKFYRRRI